MNDTHYLEGNGMHQLLPHVFGQSIERGVREFGSRIRGGRIVDDHKPGLYDARQIRKP